ncbi:MAG: hypothetical protein ABIN01_05900 [Ferruginibacter sp.]
MKIVGVIIFFIGIFLLFGNLSGCMTTFPYAGFIVMTIGGLITKAGDD